MRDRFSVCENPYYTCFSYSPNNQPPKPKTLILICGCFVFVCPSVRPCVRPSVRPSASASTRPRPPQTSRSPEQSVVASSDLESSVNVMVFAHAESIPHAFRGCRDHYICHPHFRMSFRPRRTLVGDRRGWHFLSAHAADWGKTE